MDTILNGKELSKLIEENLAFRVKDLALKNKQPMLATIIVGEDPASKTYVKMKTNACERVGIKSLRYELKEETTTSELLELIDMLNKSKEVTGILLQHPVPSHIDERACFNAIDIKKDVDGVNTESFGLMANKLNSFVSATPLGIMTLLKHYQIDLAGLNVVIIGRSQILGLPLAMLMMNENATVTICHSKTSSTDLNIHLMMADVIVGACGIPNFIKPEHIFGKPILIDAGYKDGKGDISPECYEKAKFYTPVPGGVGPMTIASLLTQTVEAGEEM